MNQKSCRVFVFSVLTLLLFPNTHATAQDTRNEKLAAGILKPTAKDVRVLKKECNRLTPQLKNRSKGNFGIGNVYEVQLPAFSFVPILAIEKSKGSKYQIVAYKDLPHGGIAGADICGLGFLHNSERPTKSDPKVSMQLVVVRPGINIKTDYPAAYKASRAGRPIIQQGEARYLAHRLRDPKAKDVSKEITALKRGNKQVYGFVYRGVLYVPQ